jgi:hypothetical protein
MTEASERRTKLLALVLMAIIVAPACGDGDSDASSSNGTPGTGTASSEQDDTATTRVDVATTPTTTNGGSETSTTTNGGSETSTPPMVVVTEVNLVRAIPGHISCELRVEVENQGPGTAKDVEVTATIENLRGEGAPDHYTVSDTLDGPGELAEDARATYWMVPSVPMVQGDVWIYTGDLTVAGQVVFQFGNSSPSARRCEE